MPATNQLQGLERDCFASLWSGGARGGSCNVGRRFDYAMGTLRHLLAVALFAAVHMTQAQDDPAMEAAVVQTVDALMPALPAGAAGSGQADQYLCTSVPLPDAPLKLNSIVPKPGPGVTHMLLFGERPGLKGGRRWRAAPSSAVHCSFASSSSRRSSRPSHAQLCCTWAAAPRLSSARIRALR